MKKQSLPNVALEAYLRGYMTKQGEEDWTANLAAKFGGFWKTYIEPQITNYLQYPGGANVLKDPRVRQTMMPKRKFTGASYGPPTHKGLKGWLALRSREGGPGIDRMRGFMQDRA